MAYIQHQEPPKQQHGRNDILEMGRRHILRYGYGYVVFKSKAKHWLWKQLRAVTTKPKSIKP